MCGGWSVYWRRLFASAQASQRRCVFIRRIFATDACSVRKKPRRKSAPSSYSRWSSACFHRSSSWPSVRQSFESWSRWVESKSPCMIAAILVVLQLGGCVSPRHADADATTAGAGNRQETKPPAATQDAKGFAEAVQRGDAAWQAQDLDRAIYYYVQAMDKSPNDAP